MIERYYSAPKTLQRLSAISKIDAIAGAKTDGPVSWRRALPVSASPGV
jgi:hypothetical protein